MSNFDEAEETLLEALNKVILLLLLNLFFKQTNEDPETFKEAMESLDNESWIQGIMEEMKSLKRNDIWQLIDLPRDAQTIGLKWVFTKKSLPLE